MRTLTHDQQSGLRKLVAREAIEQCIADHSRGIDRTDLELLKSAYHEGADVNYGFFSGPATELAQILVESQRPMPITQHRPSNISLRIQDDKAVSESYVLAYFESELEDGNVQSLVAGRYLDCLECRDGEWKLVHRTYVLDWNSTRPSTANLRDPSIAGDHFLPIGDHAARDPGNAWLAVQSAGFGQLSREQNTMTQESLNDETLDRLLSRPVLQELLTAYCRGVDRLDEQLLASIFHDDATVVTGTFNGPGEQFPREIVAFCREHTERTIHTVNNHWFDIRGDDAVAECYVIAVQTAKNDSGELQDTLTGGRYLTRFARRSGEWKIAQHTFVMDWNLTQPCTAVFDQGMFGDMVQGTRGAEDPVYAFWKQG